MKNLSLYAVHLTNLKGLALGQHALCALVLVAFVAVFEINRVGTGKRLHVDTFGTHALHLFYFETAKLCYQLIRHLTRQARNGIRKIK